MSEKIVSVLKRVARTFLFGAVASMGIVTAVVPQNWTELASLINVLLVSAIYGGVTAVIAGIDKWYRWED